MTTLMTYHHTQRGPLCLMIYIAAFAMLATAWTVPQQTTLQMIFLAAGGLTLLLGASFHELTVTDAGDRLLIRFGPVPLFQRTVCYDDIEKVRIGRTTILEGWGIHYSPRGGWVWNLWGRDCVEIKLTKGTLRLGTDDPENLARFLKGRMPEDDED